MKADPQEMSQPEPERLVPVYLTVGVRTSRGPGPGPLELPAIEASRLIAAKYAVPGCLPPGGPAESAVREFR